MQETAKNSTETSVAPPTRQKVEIGRSGSVVTLTLNRPEALNAFDDDMRKTITDEIPRIARNSDVYVVVLKSTSAKAFSAGGDVRALVKIAATDHALAASYFAGEYRMNWMLDCFSKPTVSLINGLCMGSGAGLTLYNTHRVAGAAYKFAMPETAIGLFPDVGVAHVLARLPWPIGLYLGLTGRSVNRADAHWLGLATHCISEAQFPYIMEQLANSEPIDPVLDGLHEPEPPGPLQAEAGLIAEFFSEPSISAIMAKLAIGRGAGQAFAMATLADLKARSPLSLAITDRHIREARTLDLRETLIQDYRLAVRCLKGRDFAEGVRAALIEKDGAPRWQHAKIEDVTGDEVASYFAPLSEEDLALPTRFEMQNLRS